MKIRFDPRALADLEAIYNYIAVDDPVAAAGVIRRIRHSIERLSVLPYSGRPGYKAGTRILSVPSLPFVVIHRVQEDFVEIVAIFHTARDHRE